MVPMQFESGKCSVENLNVQMSHRVQTVTLHRGTENPLLVLLIRLLLRYPVWFAFLQSVKLCHISMRVAWLCGQLAGEGML